MEAPGAGEIRLKNKEKTTRWDFLSTFKPPENLSIETGRIFQVEKLSENSPDFEYCSRLFLTTFGG